MQLSLPLGDLFGSRDGYLLPFESNHEGARENRGTTGARHWAAEHEALAKSGAYDVFDRSWETIAPLLKDADLGRDDRVVDPRRAFDGVFFALRTEASIQALPSCFGAGNAVHLFLRLSIGLRSGVGSADPEACTSTSCKSERLPG